MHNNNRRNNDRRFNNNKGGHGNNNKRRFGGGGGNNFDDESSNISLPQRKNFANKHEQYILKAKDCLRNGDRIEAENYFQHADHCFRMMNMGLTGGSRFDPVRMHIHNPNHQSNYNNGEQHDAQQPQSEAPQTDVAADNNGANDISSLPFMREPIEPGNNDPRIIE